MLRDWETKARALQVKIQRHKDSIPVIPAVRTRHVRPQEEEEEEEEEVDMVDDGEACCESANSEAVSQSVAGLKATSTTAFNKSLRLQLMAGGLDQKTERLAGKVVEALCPTSLVAGDFLQVVSGLTTWRTATNKLVFKQRARCVWARSRRFEWR